VLINHGANVNAKESGQWTPIHLSAGIGHLNIVKLLLERGADVHALNDEGETPYHLSLAHGDREILDLLWKHGASRARFDVIFFYGSNVMSDWHFDFSL
jgi:ankyrin repeat protein